MIYQNITRIKQMSKMRADVQEQMPNWNGKELLSGTYWAGADKNPPAKALWGYLIIVTVRLWMLYKPKVNINFSYRQNGSFKAENEERYWIFFIWLTSVIVTFWFLTNLI